MNRTRTFLTSLQTAPAQAGVVIVLILLSSAASGADVKPARPAAEAKCIQCHAAKDWEGEDAASLESLIHDIVSGKVKHKVKVELSAAEIADIAGYWVSE